MSCLWTREEQLIAQDARAVNFYEHLPDLP